jgi:hypothetical protein
MLLSKHYGSLGFMILMIHQLFPFTDGIPLEMDRHGTQMKKTFHQARKLK